MNPSNPQNDFLFKRGMLIVKRGLISQKRFVCVCAPVTMTDVQKVFESCFVVDPYAPIQSKSIPWLGNLTAAAVKGVPILFITSQEVGEDPTFTILDSTTHLKEENEVGKACTFEVVVGSTTLLRFSSTSSVDYQEWIHAFRLCLELTQLSRNQTSTPVWLQQLPVAPNKYNKISQPSNLSNPSPAPSPSQFPSNHVQTAPGVYEYVSDYGGDARYSQDVNMYATNPQQSRTPQPSSRFSTITPSSQPSPSAMSYGSQPQSLKHYPNAYQQQISSKHHLHPSNRLDSNGSPVVEYESSNEESSFDGIQSVGPPYPSIIKEL
ncbi:hypothetical protein BC833DRAFT_592429 [Globomyces pollinis-pini]|nr:hypothetical protein BC833DRAFT_592429 [Globomyces pollinis-pini]